jgi:hypothetical protein
MYVFGSRRCMRAVGMSWQKSLHGLLRTYGTLAGHGAMEHLHSWDVLYDYVIVCAASQAILPTVCRRLFKNLTSLSGIASTRSGGEACRCVVPYHAWAPIYIVFRGVGCTFGGVACMPGFAEAV